jgi:tetratricopeptide (TPR) repeat protein
MARLMDKLQNSPDDPESLLSLGHIHYQIGEYEKSVEYLEQVLRQVPGQTYANLFMGYSLMELNRRHEAKKFFETAVKNDPAQMGLVMKEMAFAELLDKHAADPGNLGLTNSVAQFYNFKNEFLKALDYSLKAQEQDPMNLPLLQSIVYSYRGLGEPNEVLIYGTRYELVAPDEIDLQYIMAEMYVKTLRCHKALPYLEKVLKKDDDFRDAKKLLNECQPRSTA